MLLAEHQRCVCVCVCEAFAFVFRSWRLFFLLVSESVIYLLCLAQTFRRRTARPPKVSEAVGTIAVEGKTGSIRISHPINCAFSWRAFQQHPGRGWGGHERPSSRAVCPSPVLLQRKLWVWRRINQSLVIYELYILPSTTSIFSHVPILQPLKQARLFNEERWIYLHS